MVLMCVSLVANDIGIFSCCIHHLQVLFGVFMVFAHFLIRFAWLFNVCVIFFFLTVEFREF